MLSPPTALLCLVLWAGSLPYLAETNHGNLPGDHSSLCFGDDTVFKKCNCFCYDVGNGQCFGATGREIECDASECPDGSELFTEFPSLNLDAPNPNISCLEITNFQFTRLTYSDLSQFPNLTTLKLEHGQLQRIDNNAFNATPELIILEVDNNQLTSWPPVAGLSELLVLEVHHNRIQSLEPGDLSGCEELGVLEAANNDIKRLGDGVFEDNCKLQRITFSNNPLEVIEEDVFKGLLVQELALSNTRISKLPVNGLRQLQELDLSLTPSYRELFPAFTGNTSDIYQGKTFPLLRDAKFFYHAHCCHLTDPQNTDYHYLVEMANTPPPILDILQELSSRQVREVGATTEGELLCFNTTTSEAVDISVSVDAQNVTVDEFCADYCSLQPDICMGGCSNDSGPASGMESEIVCVQRPVPTPTACYSPESFSSQVTTTVCSSVSVASPGPSPTPLDICSTEFCETQSVFDFTQCDLCQQFGLGCTDADPTCLVFIIIGRLPPGFCDCHTQRRKREVAAHSENTVVHKGQSRTERATTECQVERVGVVCRSAVACPSPSPSQRRRRSEASQGLPEGWFFPDSNSTDVICSRGTLPPPRCPLPLDLSGYEGAEIPMCSPEPDAFHPCEDLLGNADILRVAIWFVIIMALIMNMIVIIVTIGYSFILHRTKQELFIMHFLYLNLAMADFLMGVYLFSIAVVDLDTLGDFAAAAIRWQTGPGCRFAGFCAITSTVVSVYTLVVITLERTYTIVNVMHRRKLSKKVAFTVMALGWVLGVVMGLLPLVGVNDYSTVAVCLPFDVSTKVAKGYIAFLLLATGLSFIVIVGSYLLIFYEVTCSEGKRRLRSGALSSVWKQELRVGLRMFFLVFTNFVCWFPIALLSLSAAFGESLLTNVSVAKVFIVFVFPLNACVNPILYSISTTKFRQNFCLLLGKCGLFQQTNARIKSKRHGIPSHTSKGSGQFSPREYLRRLSTRLISLSSIPSVSTSDDGRRDSRVADIRRESNFSQGSFDDHRHLLAARRSSNFSTLSNNSSNEELGSGYKVPRRNSAFSDSSQEEQATGFPNPAYRSDSPPVARDEKLRQATKISASSLGTLPEEVEVAPTPVQEVVQNQGYTDEEEEGYYTEQKDSSSTTPDSNTESLVHKSGVIDPQSLQHHIMELPSAQTALGPHGNDTVPTAVIDTSDSSSQLETESMKEEIVFDEPLTCL